jgi:hypothetical protein
MDVPSCQAVPFGFGSQDQMPAKILSPYLIGILASVHLPAYITDGKSMFNVKRS